MVMVVDVIDDCDIEDVFGYAIDLDAKPERTCDRKLGSRFMASAIWNRARLTFTWAVRQLRKDSTQLMTVGKMPYPQCLTSMRKRLIKSKALAKSKDIKSISYQ